MKMMASQRILRFVMRVARQRLRHGAMILLTTPPALEFSSNLNMIHPKTASATLAIAAIIHDVTGDAGGGGATAGCIGNAPSGDSGGWGPRRCSICSRRS